MLIDVHAHLCDPIFDPDRGEVLARAEAAGVGRVIAVGETLVDARRNLDLAAMHQQVLPAAGLYPTRLDLEEAEAMRAFIRRHRTSLVAIGEVGLDYWAVQDDDDRQMQQEIFGGFIALGQSLDLPLSVHSRSAGRQAVAMLLARPMGKVILHAFDGKASTAMPAVEAGCYFSIPPSIVRSRQKQKLVYHLPLTSLLLESDSPVLGPEAGRRNEPANLIHAAASIATIKKIRIEAVLEAVRHNTRQVFGDVGVA